MVAFHFPPLAGSSGIQRTLRFAQHLPDFGWQPLILTAVESAYERTSNDLSGEVPPGLVVRRARAYDAARQLSFRGRYPAVLARPDRWMTWQFDAVRIGGAMIRELRPHALWSTYPIATAHLIADKLTRRHRLPWLADFRDPMAQEGYPADPKTWNSFKRIEDSVCAHAALSIFTTPGAAREYRGRFGGPAAERIRVIENGYDEGSFNLGEAEARAAGPLVPGVVTLLHSGIVYPFERDPTQLMQALGRLHRAGAIDARSVRVRFRAPVHGDLLLALAGRYGVRELVEVLPPIPYREALAEMLRADGLLVLQASNCNEQIPAKVYECFRARRPLLLLTDPLGETAAVSRAAGVSRVARLDNADEIEALIREFVSEPGVRAGLLPREDAVLAASRKGRTEALARTLDEAVGAVG
jgi:hypothetical protein